MIKIYTYMLLHILLEFELPSSLSIVELISFKFTANHYASRMTGVFAKNHYDWMTGVFAKDVTSCHG